MSKQQDLTALEEQIIADNVCPELANQATRLVFGSGNNEADVVFVGEAPGKKEDETGEPFVGASGSFLDEMLESIYLKRRDIYITNIVKYRPPDNRDPLPKEKEDFWPYLLQQIQILQPKIVVTLGRHSGQAFIPGLRIGADHGTPQTVELGAGESKISATILPLYHPAAALYNGSLRETLLEDFKIISKNIK